MCGEPFLSVFRLEMVVMALEELSRRLEALKQRFRKKPAELPDWLTVKVPVSEGQTLRGRFRGFLAAWFMWRVGFLRILSGLYVVLGLGLVALLWSDAWLVDLAVAVFFLPTVLMLGHYRRLLRNQEEIK